MGWFGRGRAREDEETARQADELAAPARADAAARARLIDLLGSIAGYNDKGYEWSGHGAEQVRQYRSEVQQRIVTLVAEIGEPAFSAGLLAVLLSGEAAEDSTGEVQDRARRELIPLSS